MHDRVGAVLAGCRSPGQTGVRSFPPRRRSAPAFGPIASPSSRCGERRSRPAPLVGRGDRHRRRPSRHRVSGLATAVRRGARSGRRRRGMSAESSVKAARDPSRVFVIRLGGGNGPVATTPPLPSRTTARSPAACPATRRAGGAPSAAVVAKCCGPPLAAAATSVPASDVGSAVSSPTRGSTSTRPEFHILYHVQYPIISQCEIKQSRCLRLYF